MTEPYIIEIGLSSNPIYQLVRSDTHRFGVWEKDLDKSARVVILEELEKIIEHNMQHKDWETCRLIWQQMPAAGRYEILTHAFGSERSIPKDDPIRAYFEDKEHKPRDKLAVPYKFLRLSVDGYGFPEFCDMDGLEDLKNIKATDDTEEEPDFPELPKTPINDPWRVKMPIIESMLG